MQCPICGFELRAGVAFCENCGTPVTLEQKPKKKRWLLPVILGVVLVAAAAVFLLWFFGDARAYGQAQALYDQGRYTEAETAFRALGDYQDSADMVTECRYRQAKAAYDSKDYQKAETLFAELGDYKDSKDWVEKSKLGMLLGTWGGEVDIAEVMGDTLTTLGPYLKGAIMVFTLELKEDGSFVLSYQGDAVMPALKNAVIESLRATMAESGITEEQIRQVYGMGLDELADTVLADFDTTLLYRTFTGTYTVKDGAVYLNCSGSTTFEGRLSDGRLTLEVSPFGPISFTHK